jgi:hypothetical protein
MVYHWVYHISWYLVWTLSGYKDFSSISSNGGTAFDSSIPNYSKPESRWFQIVITWCLMVPRLSPISSVSRCMDMCGSFQVSDAWWCEKKVGIDTHTVTYVYIYNYIQLSAHIVDVKPKTELTCEMLWQQNWLKGRFLLGPSQLFSTVRHHDCDNWLDLGIISNI